MKKSVKTVLFSLCVFFVGFTGFKAYNAGNQSEVNMLLAENVEALSWNEDGTATGPICGKYCDYCYNGTCTFNWGDVEVDCQNAKKK